MDLNKYLEEYRELFDDQFPLMACLGMDEDDIIKEIKECINKKQKYEYDAEVFH